jgi:dihydropteroate synthase
MQFKDKVVDLSIPRVMGILNVTPDSFSDGGKFSDLDHALYQAETMIDEGADFIDVGGESTRPGAAAVSLQKEIDRVVPVIENLATRFDVVLSVDTSKAKVMSEAVIAGAGLINDVRALQEEGALKAVSNSGAAVCLMHMQGQPRTMQADPKYSNVITDVISFLADRIDKCMKNGISEDKIIVDPGFGFGKTLSHNYQLLNGLNEMLSLGVPILSGTSRKSMIGNLLNRDVDQRLAGSIAAATVSIMNGAKIIRVHDVKESVDAVKVVLALNAYEEK